MVIALGALTAIGSAAAEQPKVVDAQTAAQPNEADKPADPKQPATSGKTQYKQVPFDRPDAQVRKAWSKKPSAAPDIGVEQRDLNKALSERLGFSPEKAFAPPDWTEPLRDIEADSFEGAIGEDELLLKGNVRLRLDTLGFTADEFWYSEPTGEMRAKGNVLLSQDPSLLAADELFYKVPPEAEMPQPRILGPHMDEQQKAKLRLSYGALVGKDVRIFQPSQQLSAKHLTYNIAESTGTIETARGRAGIYYFGADRLRLLGPQSVDADQLWITSCDQDPPHYRILMKNASIREGRAVYGTGVRLQLGNVDTPLYWPQWGYKPGRLGAPVSIDFDSGHRAGIGYFVNVGQQFRVSPDATLGLRLFPTTREGVGFGIDSDYDFTETPASPLYLGKGSIRTLYTTKDRGYVELYHRHEPFDDTVVLFQVEQWSDRDFYKDFFYDLYRNRTAPTSFVNVTHTKPTWIATGTYRVDTHNFVRDTERMPEFTYHLLTRRLADSLYFTFDTIDGYIEREPWSTHAVRLANVGRLTYDIDLHEALSITPFVELEGTFYSDTRNSDESDFRFTNTWGATAQTRLHKRYPGALGFSGFKHVILPSATYSYRPEPSMGVDDTPYFDAYDVPRGRSRIETKLENVVFGQDAETQEVWQVGRLTLYQGNDFWNEIRKAEDYEAELDLRPRPWWGWLLAAERHRIDDEGIVEAPAEFQAWWSDFYKSLTGKPFEDMEEDYLFYSRPGDYNRILTYLYYDDFALDGNFNAQLGFSYTETQDNVYNKEILYGAGWKLSEKWAVAFEHRYDFEQDELTQQKYEIRRNLHCWEAALQFRDRQQGWDVGVAFSIVAFPGTRVKF